MLPVIFIEDLVVVLPGAGQQARVGDDEIVRVVDLVGHSGDHLAEGCHLVGLDQLGLDFFRFFLQPQAVGDVAEGTENDADAKSGEYTYGLHPDALDISS